MPRSYLRVLPELYERRLFGSERHRPNSIPQTLAFVGVLCFAEQQSPRGRFKSRAVLEALLAGPKGAGRPLMREVGFLIEQGDLVSQPDGSLYVEGWDELQEGNWQVAERMARYRARKGEVTARVTPAVTVPVTTDASRVGSRKANKRKGIGGNGVTPTPRQLTHLWLSDHGAATPVGWVNTTLNELVKVYGHEAVIAAWERSGIGRGTSKQYIQYAEQGLAASPRSKLSGHTRTAQEGQDAFDR